jgi:putative ABC transport system permease protein
VAPVAVINEALAKRLFGGSSVGRTISLAPAGRPVRLEIVGEVADARNVALTKAPQPAFYVPFVQSNLIPRTILLAKVDVPLATISQALTKEIHAVDPNAPVTAIEGLDQAVAQQLSESRFEAVILSGFAILGIVLAVCGIYGLVSYAISERVREFGIRLALGAQPREYLRPRHERKRCHDRVGTHVWRGCGIGVFAISQESAL